MIINCPRKVKSEEVSKTINPVTQTADVEVKTASTREIPSVVAFGRESKSVPIRISNRKLRINTNAGWIFSLLKVRLIRLSSHKNSTSIRKSVKKVASSTWAIVTVEPRESKAIFTAGTTIRAITMMTSTVFLAELYFSALENILIV